MHIHLEPCLYYLQFVLGNSVYLLLQEFHLLFKHLTLLIEPLSHGCLRQLEVLPDLPEWVLDLEIYDG